MVFLAYFESDQLGWVTGQSVGVNVVTFSNRLKATMAVLLVSFSLFLTFVAWSYRGKIEFDKSLIYLMDTVLDSHYKVVSAKLNKDEIDKDGYWLGINASNS